MTAGINQLRSTKTILPRPTGAMAPVTTPVSIAFDGDRAYFRSYDKAWKMKRLARNPYVEAAPSTFRGKRTGVAVRGEARLLTGDQARTAARALARRHRVLQGTETGRSPGGPCDRD